MTAARYTRGKGDKMKPIETSFTKMFHTAYPIVGAPMFLVSYEELVISVSEAGGLGTFPVPNYISIDDLKRALKTIKTATSKPIGVNLQLHGRFPWKEQLRVCLDAGVDCFVTALGDPRLILSDVHANNGKVLTDVTTLKHALKARDSGVDGLIAVGAGAGGHGGTVSTLVLVPYLVEKTNLPVLAAGGISTGSQMAAALAVGACGVVVGTRLIATPEARVSNEYREAVIAAGPEDILYTNEITGNYANWLAASIENLQDKPDLASAKWREIWSAGQSVAQIDNIIPAAVVICDMVNEFYEVCRKMQVYL